MNRKLFVVIGATATIAGCCRWLPASNLTPNYSFESPVVTGGFPVSLTIDNWTTTGPADEVVDIGSGPQNSGVGIFTNPSTGTTHVANADQNQLAYMFSGSTHTLSQVLNQDYQAGVPYSLTVGVSNAGSPPTVGDQLSIQLFYTTAADPNTPIILATRNVVEGTDSLSQSELTDFTADAGTLTAGNSAIGNPIGILFTTTGVGGGEFDLDNVRLTPNVPEPAAAGISGVSGLLALLRRRRRIAAAPSLA